MVAQIFPLPAHQEINSIRNVNKSVHEKNKSLQKNANASKFMKYYNKTG